MYIFIITNMNSLAEQVMKFYCKRRSMEKFIKERKNEFNFIAVDSSYKVIDVN